MEEYIPDEGTPLWKVLSENGLLDADVLMTYAEFRAESPGGSKGSPIVISETEDYVPLEYDFLDFILQGPVRFVNYRLLRQSLYNTDGRYYDAITVEVTDLDKLLSGKDCTSEETWWFDITAGFTALQAQCHL